MLDLLTDVRLTQRRVPVHLADADREGDDDGLLVFLRLRVIVEAVLREVHHDAIARSRRKNALSGEQDVLAVAGNPHIRAGIGADDLLVSEAVASRDIEQGVLVRRLDVLIGADERAAVRGQLVDGRPGWRAAEQHSTQREAYPEAHVHSGKITYVIDFK